MGFLYISLYIYINAKVVRNLTVKIFSQYYVMWLSSASVNNERCGISWVCVNQHMWSNSVSISFYSKAHARSSPVDTFHRWERLFSTIRFP